MVGLRSFFVAGVVMAVFSEPSSQKYQELQKALQSFLDSYAAKHPTTSVQLGFKSEASQFGLAAGQYWRPDRKTYQPVSTDDVFLFGSGTKTLTAAAVMGLVTKGIVSMDDPLEKHADAVLDRMKPGASMHRMFGANGSKVTVGQVLRMTSGVQDFDFPEFDKYLLMQNETYRAHSPYETIEFASMQTPPFVCEPGTCVSYSSTNYVLAGLILAAHSNMSEWWQLDEWKFLPNFLQADMPKSYIFQKEMLNEKLTVPGHAAGGWGGYPNTTIWNQSSTILGWTCGNLVATAEDVAVFFWDLLGPTKKVLREDVVNSMMQFDLLNVGWGKGFIAYGTGLMLEHTGAFGAPKWGEWGSYIGHGGDTYGFLSEQGLVYGLNATISVVANEDSDGQVQPNLMCNAIKISAKVLLDLDIGLRCSDRSSTALVI